MVDLYEAVHLIHFLGAEDPDGSGPWRQVAVQAAAERLAAVVALP